jgi:hypothetical protein
VFLSHELRLAMSHVGYLWWHNFLARGLTDLISLYPVYSNHATWIKRAQRRVGLKTGTTIDATELHRVSSHQARMTGAALRRLVGLKSYTIRISFLEVCLLLTHLSMVSSALRSTSAA